MPPQVHLVADALGLEQRGEAPRGVERAGGVLPLALPAYEQKAQLRAEPVEVVAPEVDDVVHRVVEVRGVAALTPAVPGGWVVVAGHADGKREDVGPLEREVGRVEGTEAASTNDHFARAGGVVTDEWHHLIEDP